MVFYPSISHPSLPGKNNASETFEDRDNRFKVANSSRRNGEVLSENRPLHKKIDVIFKKRQRDLLHITVFTIYVKEFVQ